MFVDTKEKTRIKLCVRALDEGMSPDAQAKQYIREGYDTVALTQKGRIISDGDGMISCCEYKIGNPNSTDGEYTLIALGVTSDPCIPTDWESMIKTSCAKTCEAIRLIHLKNGYAVLTNISKHKNTAEQILRMEGLDAIDMGEGSDAEYMNSLCDELSKHKFPVSIFSSGKGFSGGVCVDAREADSQSIVRALKAGRFFSTESDAEIHISSLPSGRIQVSCTPARSIELFTNISGGTGKLVTGNGIVGTEYVPADGEIFIRASLTDLGGYRAWTGCIDVI